MLLMRAIIQGSVSTTAVSILVVPVAPMALMGVIVQWPVAPVAPVPPMAVIVQHMRASLSLVRFRQANGCHDSVAVLIRGLRHLWCRWL